jgi:hypothetical protein
MTHTRSDPTSCQAIHLDRAEETASVVGAAKLRKATRRA